VLAFCVTALVMAGCSHSHANRPVTNNGGGVTAHSIRSAAVAPKVPGAPQNVVAISMGVQAMVAWSPPPSNGGSPIQRYVITASSGATAEVTGNADRATISGLTRGGPITFTVKAKNSIGTGPESLPSAPVGV
jgi:Fibronectin type III domain